MFAALAYFAVTSARNQLRRRIARLRSPRYLVALVAGGAYMWWFLVRPAHNGGAAAVAGGVWTTRLAALGTALLAAKWWLAGADERALAFTPAEIHLLFPAPLTRRALVLAKLMRAQALILVNTVVWSVLLRGEGMELASWRRAIGLWVLFSTLYLHRLGAALATASAVRHGAAGRRRQVVPLVVVSVAGGVLLWAMAQAGATLARAWTFGPTSVLHVLGTQLDAPAARAVLAPFRVALAPSLALTGAQWLHAILPAVALLAAHAVWVLRTDVAFEEAAVEASERLAAARAIAGAGVPATALERETPERARRRRSLPLAPAGNPAAAVLWKNATTALREGAVARQLGLLGVLSIVGFVLAITDERIAEVALVVASVWGGLLVLAGPMWVRYDLRQDLPHLAVLRAWPLSGRDIVVAQIASSTAALTLFQLALVAGVLVVSFLGRLLPLGASDRVAICLAAALALPGVNAASLTVQNGAALLFPGWIRPGAGARGVEAMGQNLLSMTASTAVLALLLALPAALGVGLVYLVNAVRATGSAWVFVPAALLATVAVALELVPVIAWLGRVFERTEPLAS